MFKLSPSRNKLIKHILILCVLLTAGFIYATIVFSNSSYFSKEGMFIEQPIEFSHRLHAGDIGLDCLFCHSHVNHSANAGMPSTETCFGCHQDVLETTDYLSPVRTAYLQKEAIHWNRVNSVPDHVYFHHGKHIDKGIKCITCHGEVKSMPLTYAKHKFDMSWCLECHSDAQRNNITETRSKELQDCYTCHR